METTQNEQESQSGFKFVWGKYDFNDIKVWKIHEDGWKSHLYKLGKKGETLGTLSLKKLQKIKEDVKQVALKNFINFQTKNQRDEAADSRMKELYTELCYIEAGIKNVEMPELGIFQLGKTDNGGYFSIAPLTVEEANGTLVGTDLFGYATTSTRWYILRDKITKKFLSWNEVSKLMKERKPLANVERIEVNFQGSTQKAIFQ